MRRLFGVLDQRGGFLHGGPFPQATHARYLLYAWSRQIDGNALCNFDAIQTIQKDLLTIADDGRDDARVVV